MRDRFLCPQSWAYGAPTSNVREKKNRKIPEWALIDKLQSIILMKKTCQTESSVSALSEFNVTFELTLYLHSFQAISISSQGSYYIAVSLCPKNAILANPDSPSQNSMGKVRFTHTFFIKYTNHLEPIGECLLFTFTLQENFVHNAQTERKNVADLPFNNVLVLSCELMKKVHDDIEIHDDEPKLCQNFVRVGLCSLQMRAKDQFSFCEHISAHFDFPYSGKLTGSAFCLIKSIEPTKFPSIDLESPKAGERKRSLSFTNLGSSLRNELALLKKVIKRHIFSAFMVRRQMKEVFKIKENLHNPLSDSQRTWNNLSVVDKSEYQSNITQFKIGSSSNSSVSHSNFKQLNTETETNNYFLNKLTVYQCENRSINQMVNDMISLCELNQKFLGQLMYKIQEMEFEGQIYNIDTLEDQYEKNKMIIYSEKVKSEEISFEKAHHYPNTEHLIGEQQNTSESFEMPNSVEDSSFVLSLGESLLGTQENYCECAMDQMKKYSKDIGKMKNLGLKKCFSHSQSYFNFMPSNPCKKIDSCPYIFHSATVFGSQALGSLKKVKNWDEQQNGVKNVFIFAHGYQANSQNMEILKIIFKEMFIQGKFLVLESLEGTTDRDLRHLGKRAAKQIEEYLAGLRKRSKKNLRIIMVGHSMGGIILRTALQHLEKETLELLHTYISFATPHLGYLHCQSIITEAGIKIIESVYASQSVRQLSNRDHSSIKETFIYELSQVGPLTYFKHVLLFSSMEDKYVTWNSARAQVNKYSKGVVGKSSGGWSMRSQRNFVRYVEQEMVNNIFGLPTPQLKGKLESIHRFEVDFNITTSGIENLIGRTAHVAFLVNRHVVPMAMKCCLKDSIYRELKKDT